MIVHITNGGGRAFPVPVRSDGMTLRDYFAAKAMQGMLSGEFSSSGADRIAEWSYKHADAMLKARTYEN